MASHSRSRSSLVGTFGEAGDRVSMKNVSHYQVYRGMSPNTSNRLELRIKELEESLESERAARIRAEKELSEISFHVDDLNEKLDEAESAGSTQSELSRRREQEILKLKKDLELVTSQHESSDATQRKRFQESLKEVCEQLDHLKHDKIKHDKDRQQLLLEIESLSSLLEACNKAKAAAESKLDGMDSQLRRLQGHVDELGRQNQEFNAMKARLFQENQELGRHVHELDTNNGILSKAKMTLQQQLDEAKSTLEEETRERNQLAIQLTNIQVEYDNLSAHLEEEMDAALETKNQLQRSQTDYQQLKSRYDKDIIFVTEELEQARRKLTARISELEEMVNQAQSKSSKLEKEKTSLQIEIRDILGENDKINAAVTDLTKRLKQSDHSNLELRGRVDELTRDLEITNSERQALLAEVPKLKTTLDEVNRKLEISLKENKLTSDAFRDIQGQNKDLGRNVNELQSIRLQLEGERNSLAAELSEVQDALREAQALLEAKNLTLAQIRTDLERRLKEKDEEMEAMRKSSQKALEELQKTIVDVESKFRAEINRLKNKYDVDISEYDRQLENFSRTNNEVAKANKSLSSRIKELELAFETERRAAEDAKQAVIIIENKRIQLQRELEDLRHQLDTAERARKARDGELAESTVRISELTSAVTNAIGERRRLEVDMAKALADLEENSRAHREADDRADRLQLELNRVTDELRQEQDNSRMNETHRRQMEVEMRELVARLEQVEIFAQREGKRLVAKLQARLHDVESELDAEQKRCRDVIAENRKLHRLLQDQKTQSDESERTIKQLCEQVNALQVKIRTLARQLSEAEEVVAITMNKYRKANQILQEYESQSETVVGTCGRPGTSASAILSGGGCSRRSLSVTREITRVVRV